MRSALASRRGVTLTELMVAVIVITIGVLGLMQSFGFISRSLRVSRQRTIADNLAQEKIESLKQLSYSQLLVTTSTVSDPNFTPPLSCDAVNYPPETLSLWGGAPLQRSVYVSFASVNNGAVTPLPWSNGDTGLKEITVYVTWNQDGSWRKISLTNLVENPNISALDSTISGTVSKSGGGALAGAIVQVIGNRQWQAVAGPGGAYSFNVVAGSYTVNASSAGYYPQMSASVSAPAGGGAAQNFALTAVASGTIGSDSVYIDANLVVSQVVASTDTQGGDGNIHNIEYVELFNPTPFSIPVGQGGVPSIKLNYLAQGGGVSQPNFPLTYVSTYVPPGSYYLIASATSVFINGAYVNADAYYAAPLSLYQSVIQRDKSGAVQIADAAGGILDGVGWSLSGGAAAPWSEGAPYALAINSLQFGQLVRMSSACALNAGYGRAYDSGDNSNNFVYSNSVTYSPRNTSVAQAVISGIPAVGGHATANDGKSPAASIVAGTASAPPQTCPTAYFNIAGVTTGTWTVEVSSGLYTQTVSNVAVTQGATTSLLNGATAPPSPYGFAHVALSSTTANGYISGTIASASGAPLAGITVSGGGASAVSDAGGVYVLTAANGPVNVTANPNNLNPNYVAQGAVVAVNTGLVATANFVLSQGGVIKGCVTTGLSPLPGAVVAASGSAHASGASDATGSFYVGNLTTGTYTLSPVLDPDQTSSPASISVTLATPGSTVFAGTFTVSGAYAAISGSVLSGGNPITTGVLVIASSVTITDPAPAIYASSSASIAPYYAATSKADGTYSVLVRGSTTYTYNLRAYHPVVDLNTGAAASTSKTRAGVSAAPGAAVSAQDFTWP